MRRIVVLVLLLALAGCGADRGPELRAQSSEPDTAAAPPTATLPPATTTTPVPAPEEEPPARHSRALGRPSDGRLVDGVQLPVAAPGLRTWDPILKRVPNRPWRRWGTERLVATLERVAEDFHVAHPGAPPLLIGDLSRPQGGNFGPQWGWPGHASHQNGLDADVYYPRRDGLLRAALRPDQVDLALAQELVDRFLALGPRYLFVGPSLHLRGPKAIVQALRRHDDHVHVRLRALPGGG